MLRVARETGYLCEDVVGLVLDPAGVSVGCQQQFECSHVHVGTQGPEVRLLDVIHTLELLHLQTHTHTHSFIYNHIHWNQGRVISQCCHMYK